MGNTGKINKRKLFRVLHTVKKTKQKQMKLLLAQTWQPQKTKSAISTEV